jgi:dTDP-4-amino-4,6-dideoxygalactose transaminase/ADP-ribose pyrophosphatase YjhB (NUDIX family)
MIQQHFCTTTYVFNEQGDKCLLIRHKKLPYYLPPGGHIDENEDYLASSQREVAEELGFSPEDLHYPEYIHTWDGACLQPWAIQKYTIVPSEHFHYDLIFVAVIREDIAIRPGEGESQDVQWFAVDAIDELETTSECKQNIKNASRRIRDAYAKEQVQQDPYLWPRYDEGLKSELARYAEGHDFNSWNLGDLYDDVPGSYARKMGVAYGVFTATGTAGLHAILMALGLRPGDEVIVPAMTFIRAVTPLTHLGLQPVIVDIDAKSGNIDPQAVKQAITPRTKAVIAVHMWGVPADAEQLAALCKRHDIKLIEDFSHAHFSKIGDNFVGSYGDASFASLQRKKNISVGEGGIVVTNDKALYERLQQVTSPGSFPDASIGGGIDFSGYGLNLRMSPFAAVTAKYLLSGFDRVMAAKQRSVEVLTGILAQYPEYFELVELPEYASDISWYSYKLVLKEVVLEKLKAAKLWKFSDFGYPAIADSVYWQKDTAYYPFCLNIKPRVAHDLPNMETYTAGRVTLNIPTVSSDYWTSERICEWKQALADCLQ